MESNIQLMKS